MKAKAACLKRCLKSCFTRASFKKKGKVCDCSPKNGKANGSHWPKVTQDVDWSKYPHAAKWLKEQENAQKKLLARERGKKTFQELEKNAKNPKQLEELYRALEAKTRGSANYYLHKNKVLTSRICFLKPTVNDVEFLKAMDKYYAGLNQPESNGDSSSSPFHLPCYS